MKLSIHVQLLNRRGAHDPMKMSDIGFLKTKLNRTDLKITKTENAVSASCQKTEKPTLAVWGRFFMLSHSQFIFQHDRIG